MRGRGKYHPGGEGLKTQVLALINTGGMKNASDKKEHGRFIVLQVTGDILTITTTYFMAHKELPGMVCICFSLTFSVLNTTYDHDVLLSSLNLSPYFPLKHDARKMNFIFEFAMCDETFKSYMYITKLALCWYCFLQAKALERRRKINVFSPPEGEWVLGVICFLKN